MNESTSSFADWIELSQYGWQLKPGAPADVKKDFEEYMATFLDFGDEPGPRLDLKQRKPD